MWKTCSIEGSSCEGSQGLEAGPKPTQKPSKTGTQFSDKMPKMQFETLRRGRWAMQIPTPFLEQ